MEYCRSLHKRMHEFVHIRWTSPLGKMHILHSSEGLREIMFDDALAGTFLHEDQETSDLANEAIRQLKDYFEGKRKQFNLPLDFEGTPFQKKVWEVVCKIPYGQTITYYELSREVGRCDAIRAVAAAVGANPLLIVIPCHRVVGKSGKLTGYAGGIERKRRLLELESKYHDSGRKILF